MLSTLANEYTDLLLAGKAQEAANKYWAANVVIIKPSVFDDNAATEIKDFDCACAKLSTWLQHHKVDDISIDGPFITGNQFALFIDMQITNIASGKHQYFSEFVTLQVRNNKIIEARCFYK